MARIVLWSVELLKTLIRTQDTPVYEVTREAPYYRKRVSDKYLLSMFGTAQIASGYFYHRISGSSERVCSAQPLRTWQILSICLSVRVEAEGKLIPLRDRLSATGQGSSPL